MPARVKMITGTCTESKSVVRMPCGYSMTVRTGARDMFIRMHKKACKKCPKDAKPMIIEASTAGERPNINPGDFTQNDPQVLALAREKMSAMDNAPSLEDIDAAIASISSGKPT